MKTQHSTKKPLKQKHVIHHVDSTFIIQFTIVRSFTQQKTGCFHNNVESLGGATIEATWSNKLIIKQPSFESIKNHFSDKLYIPRIFDDPYYWLVVQ